MNDFTKELLRRSFRDGVGPYLTQSFLVAQGKIVGQRHLVFELRECYVNADDADNHICLNSYTSWQQVPSSTRTTIDNEFKHEYWGKMEWFKLGWRLWVVMRDEDIVCLSWTRGPGQCEDFFFPVSSDCAMIWQTVTMKPFRGMGILPTVLRVIAFRLFNSGIQRVYASCRNYNVSSKKGIIKAGFRQIGTGFVKRRTGQGIWYPIQKPFTEG